MQFKGESHFEGIEILSDHLKEKYKVLLIIVGHTSTVHESKTFIGQSQRAPYRL